MIFRWYRAPVLHFLLIGGLVYAAKMHLGGEVPEPTGDTIVIRAAQIERLRDGWTRQNGRSPSPREEEALIRWLVDEELLYREALALRLDEDNPSVRRHLARNMQFVDGPGEGDRAIDEETLYRRALELGLDRGDPVIHRHLAGLMRLSARRSEEPEAMTEDDLRTYYERHRERFLRPARVRLSQVFLSAERRGELLVEAARSLRERILQEPIRPREAPVLGDPFLFRDHLPSQSRSELARTFGPDFSEAVMELEPRAWSRPIASSYGLHLVWVHERTPARPASLAAVRNQVILGLEAERGERRLAAALKRLRKRYEVRIEREVT